MRLMYAQLVSPRGFRGTKYHDVILKEHLKKIVTELDKFRDEKLVLNNNAYNLGLNQMMDKIEELTKFAFHAKSEGGKE